MTGITTNNVKRRSAGGRNRTTTVKRPLRTACRMDPWSNPAALSLAAIGPRPIATLGLALMLSVALLPGRLHRLGGVLGRHGSSRHLGDHVVDHPPNRRAEDLVIEVLVVGRTRELLRYVAHERVLERRVRAGDDRDDEALGGQPGLHLGRDERLHEVDRLLGRALAHDPAERELSCSLEVVAWRRPNEDQRCIHLAVSAPTSWCNPWLTFRGLPRPCRSPLFPASGRACRMFLRLPRREAPCCSPTSSC